MPIISIAEESRLGKKGSNTKFRRRDGYIEDNATKERQHFVKRKGIYFMKIYIKNNTNEVGFGRPEILR